MNHANPTALQVGMSGTLNGWQARVAGRLVLGMELEGETYFWNEFNLVGGSGRCATLVYEETENGPEWKLFEPLEPLRPMTAAEAAQKRVGQSVELDGLPARISLVDQTKVYFIEGTPPEGVTVGDRADYFNAEDGNRMLVVSWTGDEIEFFTGRTLAAERVASAFGLPQEASGFRAGEISFTDSNPKATKFVGVVLALVTLFAAFSCISGKGKSASRRTAPEPPARRAAPALRLPTGSRGTIFMRNYEVAGQAVLAVGTIAGVYDRREYDLLVAAEHELLVQGLTGAAQEWHLFVPVDVPAGFSPFVAAAQRKGASVQLADKPATIAELFQASTLSAEGETGRAQWPAGTRYGFLARAGSDWFIARWDENAIRLYRGSKLTESQVLAALERKAP